MLLTDGYIAKEVMDMRTKMIATEVAQAASTHPGLRSQTQTSRRAAWLSRQACRMLAGIGGQLVAMGERLEQYSQSQPSLQQGKAGP